MGEDELVRRSDGRPVRNMRPESLALSPRGELDKRELGFVWQNRCDRGIKTMTKITNAIYNDIHRQTNLARLKGKRCFVSH